MTQNFFSVLAVPVVAGALLLLFWIFDGLSYIYDWVLDERGVSVYAFRQFRVYSIPFSQIEDVRFGSPLSNLFSAANFANRNGTLRRVVISKKGGWVFRKLLLTPADPDRFVENLKSALVPSR